MLRSNNEHNVSNNSEVQVMKVNFAPHKPRPLYVAIFTLIHAQIV